MPLETLDLDKEITPEEAEEIGEAALEAIPVKLDSDPARLIHEEFPSISPRPAPTIGNHSGRYQLPETEQSTNELNPEEAVQILHGFGQNEDDLLHQQRSVDRLNAHKVRQEMDDLSDQRGDMLGYKDIDIPKRFEIILGAAKLKAGTQPEDLPDNWGEVLSEITPEQIGRDTALLARVFKRRLIDGSLSAYTDLQRTADYKRLESIEDEGERTKLQEALQNVYQKQFQERDRPRQRAIRYNEQVGRKYADESLGATYLMEREPVSLSDEDIQDLLTAPEEDRQKIIAEMTDPYRYRLDKDADPEVKDRAERERLQIGVLLESLPPSIQRDLLAVEAWRFYMHKNIGDSEKAVKALALISQPEIQSAMQTLHERLKGRDAQSMVRTLTEESSEKALESLVGAYGSSVEELKQEAEKRKPDMRITINIRSQTSEGRSGPGIATIEKILLDSRRILSAHEVGRQSSMSGADARSRSIGESRAGFDAFDVITDRPVYGTLVASEEDKLLGDPDARWYGSCVITLRPEVAERCTFSWGDSARAWSGGQQNIGAGSMAFDEAVAAKVLFDRRRPSRNGKNTEIGKEYIEAQILGGVSADDIESISIPYSEVLAHRMSLRALATEFPSIRFRCVMEPTQAGDMEGIREKLKELKNIEIVVLGEPEEETLSKAA